MKSAVELSRSWALNGQDPLSVAFPDGADRYICERTNVHVRIWELRVPLSEMMAHRAAWNERSKRMDELLERPLVLKAASRFQLRWTKYILDALDQRERDIRIKESPTFEDLLDRGRRYEKTRQKRVSAKGAVPDNVDALILAFCARRARQQASARRPRNFFVDQVDTWRSLEEVVTELVTRSGLKHVANADLWNRLRDRLEELGLDPEIRGGTEPIEQTIFYGYKADRRVPTSAAHLTHRLLTNKHFPATKRRYTVSYKHFMNLVGKIKKRGVSKS